MKISVIIPTLDRSDFLFQCLQSLERQSRKPDEVVVINNGKTEKSCQTIFSFNKRLKIRYFKGKKRGVAPTRNLGMKKARYEVIAFIDDDCSAEKHWVERIVSAHQNGALALQGKEINALSRNPYASAAYGVDEAWVKFRRSRTKSFVSGNNKLQTVYYVDTKNFSFKRGLLSKYNFHFSESYRYCCEDMDLAAQFQAKGIKIFYSPRVIVYHKRPTTLKRLLLNKFRRGRDFHTYYQRWHQSTKRMNEIARTPLGEAYLKKFWSNHEKEKARLFKKMTKRKSSPFRFKFLIGLFLGKLAFRFGYFLESLGL